MKQIITPRRAAALFAGGCVSFAASAGAVAFGLRLCLTPSLPLGIYRTEPTAAVVRGAVVTVCLPEPVATLAERRGYIVGGRPFSEDGVCANGREPLGKAVLAVAGDTVTVAETGLTVNGRAVPATARLRKDLGGRVLPRVAAGVYAVRAGEVWLVATVNRRSFDSRYFGPVPTANILSVVRPVATWEEGDVLPRFSSESAETAPPRREP